MQRKKWEFSQAAVEFALILPLLLLIIFGLLEMGRLVFVYTAVLNASREAARYGAATGDVGGVLQYDDCVGIRTAAIRVGFLANIPNNPNDDSVVRIRYDQGPGSPATQTCPTPANWVNTGSRILVTVSVPYTPMVPLVPLQPLTITSTNARTLLGAINIEGTAPPPPTLPPYAITITNTATSTPTETSTPSKTATSTPTATSSSTITLTPRFSPTVTQTPTISETPTETETPTITPTITQTDKPSVTPTVTITSTDKPTVTATISPTATPLPNCGLISYTKSYNSSTYAWTVTLSNGNPNPVTLSRVYATWNSSNGNSNKNVLNILSFNGSNMRLTGNTNFTSFWTLDWNYTAALDPLYTIPANGSSTLVFDFSHDTPSTMFITGRVTVTGCSSSPLTIFP